MNYNVYKFQETDNGFYFYFLSPFSEQNIEYVAESIEHYISNEHTPMNDYLHTVDFDAVQITRVSISPIEVINKSFPHDDKNMLVSDSYKALIPPPKPKREPKKKAEKEPKEKKEPKPRGKKSTQRVEICTEPQILNMN